MLDSGNVINEVGMRTNKDVVQAAVTVRDLVIFMQQKQVMRWRKISFVTLILCWQKS